MLPVYGFYRSKTRWRTRGDIRIVSESLLALKVSWNLLYRYQPFVIIFFILIIARWRQTLIHDTQKTYCSRVGFKTGFPHRPHFLEGIIIMSVYEVLSHVLPHTE